jgi:hypothetical protein
MGLDSQFAPELNTIMDGDTKKPTTAQIEYLDAHKKAAKPVVGTIKLFDEDGIILIPTPTNDPNGRLLSVSLQYERF